MGDGIDILFGQPAPGRRCGDCTLCCKLLPVGGLDKGANTRCRYQSLKGCKVYANLMRVSPDCRAWSCRWLVDPEAHGLRRPDRSHYVVDMMPDVLFVEQDGEKVPIQALQIWVDPMHRDAHRDPELRAYLERMFAEHGVVALVRYDENDGFALFPPASSSDGQWHEVGGVVDPNLPSVADRVTALATEVMADFPPAARAPATNPGD